MNEKFYSIKDEIRILGLDDAPFELRADKKTMIVGAVFRGGSFLDGVMRTEVDVDGRDSTEKIASLVNGCKFKDLRVLMLDGLGFGGFNLVDIKELYEETKLPVIAVVRRMPDFEAIEKAVMNLRHRDYYLSCMKNAGRPMKIETREGRHIYIQFRGLSFTEAEKIVRLSATRSLIPEPLRVAHLIASGIKLGESRGGA